MPQQSPWPTPPPVPSEQKGPSVLSMPAATQPKQPEATPPTAPHMSLLNIGDHTFELDHENGQIRPYGDKPTFEQQTLAKGLEWLLPHINSTHAMYNRTI